MRLVRVARNLTRALATRAVAAGVPIFVTGQGVGPLAATGDLETLTHAAQAVSVRDELSGTLVPGATLTGDDALGLGGVAISSARARLLVHVREATYHARE